MRRRSSGDQTGKLHFSYRIGFYLSHADVNGYAPQLLSRRSASSTIQPAEPEKARSMAIHLAVGSRDLDRHERPHGDFRGRPSALAFERCHNAS
jgi:hypothetical protein